MDRQPHRSDRHALPFARKLVALSLLFCLACGIIVIVPGLTLGARAQDLPTSAGRNDPISVTAQQQIAALLADKRTRTPTQR